jgi:hypothetical protein
MAQRKAFRATSWESLEDRVVLNAHPATAGLVGALGDSYTDEYQFYPTARTHARNWVEILAFTQKADFGPISRTVSRGEPRDLGFATNWARSDATSTDMVANQLPGLTKQVATGKVRYVSIFTGANDFLFYLQAAAANPPTGPAALQQLAQIEATAQANFDTAVSTLLAASPKVRLVVATVPSLGLLPIVQSLATTPQAQALVAAADQAIAAYNLHIQAVAAANPRVALSDLAAASNGLASAGSSVPFGGTTVSLTTPSEDYHSFFLADGLHVGTIAQGVIADSFLNAIDAKFGAGVAPLTQHQIVALAKLVQFRTRNLP